MLLTTRISSRFSSIVLAQCRRNSYAISTRRHPLSVPSSYFHSLGEPHSKVVGGRASLFHHSSLNASASQRLGFSSVSPSPKQPENENSPPAEGGSTVGNNGATAKASGNAEAPEQREEPIYEESEEELTMKDLVKLVTEKEKLLMTMLKEVEKMQKEVLRSNAVCKAICVSQHSRRPRPQPSVSRFPKRPHGRWGRPVSLGSHFRRRPQGRPHRPFLRSSPGLIML